MSLRHLARASAIAGAGMLAAVPLLADCHCQVPCGIFDDPMRVSMLKEDATTIRKAMVSIRELGSSGHAKPSELNQITRWVMTKEEHASHIIELVANYMLAQRVKEVVFKTKAEYHQALEVHHAVMQAAMKAKQSVDTEACDALEHALADLAPMYTK
mmetsp:Transcript_28353/g.76385  ORF Transcript_28353/g.76385 Transcript_28353/m.76385 type:complete len:157 (-) Transcript_28353:647-1117(-)